MPMHGEFRMLKKHGEIGVSCGINPNNIIIAENPSKSRHNLNF